MNEEELNACGIWAGKPESLISRYKNGARDALSALKKRTIGTFFRSFGYDHFT